MFHEVSYTAIDNSLLMLIAGIAVGLTARRPGERRDPTTICRVNEHELALT
jgi:hypothetical protein